MYRVTGKLVTEALREKERLRSKLESMLEPREAEEARRDHHARRRPIACGMTIHTGIGCSYGCLYCYVPDMGFPMKPKPYPLTGLQLVYALASNPYFVPGSYGTLLAFGSVTEPFLPETVGKALEYLRETSRWLGNPQQISTKSVLEDNLLKEFLDAAEERISVLISISTLRLANKLEPAAPNPAERFGFMRRLSEALRHVSLFLRPIIPGVTDRELDDILKAAAEAGAKAVIPGSLRVTPGILRRLKASRIVPVDELLRRLPRSPRGPRDQVPLKMSDLKQLVARRAKRYGLHVLPSSCAANIEAHGLGCHACRWGPCGSKEALPRLDEEGARDALEALGCRPVKLRIRGWLLEAHARCRRREAAVAEAILESLARRRVLLRPPHA